MFSFAKIYIKIAAYKPLFWRMEIDEKENKNNN